MNNYWICSIENKQGRNSKLFVCQFSYKLPRYKIKYSNQKIRQVYVILIRVWMF